MNVQKQPPEAFCKKMCSWKFQKIHRKTPVPVTFLIKLQVSGLQLCQERDWPQACNFIKKGNSGTGVFL